MNTPTIDFNNLRKDHWTQEETENAKLVAGFMQTLMNEHDYDETIRKYGNSKYLQHNPGIPDGMGALVKFVKGYAMRFPEYSYDVKRILVDGDHVIFHSHVTLKAKDRRKDHKGINASDTWRIENGEIVEHWDSLQPMSASLRFLFWLIGGRSANTNGVY